MSRRSSHLPTISPRHTAGASSCPQEAILLCPDCRADADAWLEPRRHHAKNTLPANGGISAQKIRDHRRGNYQEWRDRVTYQLDLIAHICQTKHQDTP